MARITGIDLETFSSVNLKVHGLDRYVSSPDFTILMASIAEENGTTYTFDLVFHPEQLEALRNVLHNKAAIGYLSAHNAGFERSSLTKIHVAPSVLRSIIDSAVIARAQGASSSLSNASRQLLPTTHKLDTGTTLIQKFCVPNDWNGGKAPTADLIFNDPEAMLQWQEFIRYCEVDAQASREIADRYFEESGVDSMYQEKEYERLTANMNYIGWKVDLPLVKHMQVRYHENMMRAKADFRAEHDPTGALNFSSPIQLKAWCKERGVSATGFDQDKVEALHAKLVRKLESMDGTEPRFEDYTQVRAMLATKMVIGGSSLTKLKTILDTVGEDGRLRNQYLHVGAGQTYRTSGRGVQMQNLKRLGNDLLDMDLVYDDSEDLSNDVLGANLRQVFTATDRNGLLIVGDFSSVESRGLAWLAGADWKTEAYRQGQDLYKVLASKLYDVLYGDVTKDQRKMGKLGELSCGYGAGKVAVARMGTRQGLEMDEDGAQEVVTGWRDTNPEVTDLWERLNEALHAVTMGAAEWRVPMANSLELRLEHIATPASLEAIHPNARSLRMSVWYKDHRSRVETFVLERVFHGAYMRGHNVAYYKPTERKTGALWASHFVDPVTKQTRFYEVYGGKLAGILTQSFCRELFFYGLEQLSRMTKRYENVQIVGQFHDEIVVDWGPVTGDPVLEMSKENIHKVLEDAMTRVPSWARGFPLAADIKSDYRYIK